LSCDAGERKLKSYNVFVNDVPLYGAKGKPLSKSRADFSVEVRLTPGTNKVEASCMNDAGVESPRARTFITQPGSAKGDLYFIGFGVSKYALPALKLEYAAKDVVDLAATFTRMEGEHFAKVHVHNLLDEQVTVKAITATKKWLDDAREEDTLVLFIAGHGVHDDDPEATYYYLTHGADPKRLKKTAAPFELIESLLQDIKPRQKLFLMDTCESGEREDLIEGATFAAADAKGIKARTTRGIKKKSGSAAMVAPRQYLYERDRYIYNDLLRRSGAIVFSSSRGGEFSYESSAIQNGYFTSELIRALTRDAADADKDGFVSTDELRAYVTKSVSGATGGLQNPTVDRDNLFLKMKFPRAGP